MNFKQINILSAVLLIFILAGCGKQKAPAPEIVNDFFFKVQFTLGDVKLSSTSGEKTAIQGDLLKTSDVIITGKKSMADLLFGTSGVIRINENSRVTITTIADKTNNETLLNMDNGKVFLILSKLKGTGFKVKTPTVVASVRGTSFTVLSGKKGAMMSVSKGTVVVNPVQDGKIIEDKTVSLETGTKTDYIDKKAVNRIVMGKMQIPVMQMTPAEKIETLAVVKEMKIEEIPEISFELKEEVKQETVVEPVKEEKKIEQKKTSSAPKEDKAAEMKKLEEEKQKEEELKRQEEEMKKQAEEKKVKEEKIKKDRASNIPTM